MNHEFVTRMIELADKKQNELDRRGKTANELLQRADNVLDNREQWEAYHQCIDHQHEKMMGLIHELCVIRSILDRIQANQEEPR